MQARLPWRHCVALVVAICSTSVNAQTADMTDIPACYTILHNTGPVGCHSIETEATAPLVTIASLAELDAFTSTSDKSPRSVLLGGELFNPTTLTKLQNSGRCQGVLVADMASPPPSASPAPPYPYCPCGKTSGCNQMWNPAGNGLIEHAYNFPVVLLNASATELLRQQAKPSAASTSYPEHVVEMRYHMDVFDGYRQVGGEWYQLQAHDQCCPQCSPDCGRACCDKKRGFECMSNEDRQSASGWEQPTCARRGGPNSFSCIEQGTCLPLGGFNVWSLSADSFPPRHGDKIVLAAAAMDSASMFHDASPGAASDGTALVGLIAATDALRRVRGEMKGGAAVMTALLQAEAWDNTGSRRLMEDVLRFECRQQGKTTGGASLCLNPVMLAPQIQEINASNIGFYLEVAQLPGVGERGKGPGELFVHTECNPSTETQRVVDLLSSMPALSNASRVSKPSLPAPLPRPSSLRSVLRESSDAALAAIPGALLAGYDGQFRTPYFHSHFDTPRAHAPVDTQEVCLGASAVARSLFVASTGRHPPPALAADCALVASLSAALLDPSSPHYKGSAYTGVYLPPTRRGPSAREKFIREQLALASRSELAPGCDCCSQEAGCGAEEFVECVGGRCVRAAALFHDAFPVGLAWSRNRFVVANSSLPHQIWTESNWQSNVGTSSYLRDSPANEQVVVVVGTVFTVATAAVTAALLRYYDTHFKQN